MSGSLTIKKHQLFLCSIHFKDDRANVVLFSEGVAVANGCSYNH